eukprot:TRINITY_DN2112_c0_g1_i1.p1 TRINITY_DN2112_c0_g1~~TRINITY_DN2112_c0_g1_i1.p1  ORF type:complete len:387 (+),score=79.56 TRINITY_DN2112_c0_g1_i1:138-1298(+)
MAETDTKLLTNQPVVLDNGSGMLKAGFAGDEKPRTVFQNLVGRPKHKRIMVGSAVEGEHFIGSKAEEYRGLLKLKYPMEHGIVTDWLDMERVWNHAFNDLHIQSEDHPVLLTEAPLNPRKNRERAAELFFETFNVPALYISLQAVLSLYASGRTTGTVLDSGDGVTHAVPIYEGFAIPSSIQRIDIAGRDVTDHLSLLLRKSGYNFHTTAEREIVRTIKEKICYVALDPKKEEELIESEKTNKPVQVSYKLPDGNIIQIGPERFRAAEVLFDPDLIGEEWPGVHETLVNAIHRTDIDLRRVLYGNIVLSGGSTKFVGFGNRLLDEVKNAHNVPKDIKIKISAPPERLYSTWIGGSILASLATFTKMWVSSEEYEDSGASIVNTKFF